MECGGRWIIKVDTNKDSEFRLRIRRSGIAQIFVCVLRVVKWRGEMEERVSGGGVGLERSLEQLELVPEC